MQTTFRERFTAPLGWWIGVAVFGVSCGWIVLVVSTWPAGITTAVVAALAAGAGLVRWGSVVVETDGDDLLAGGATLPAAARGAVDVLGWDDWRAWMGPRADARAWVVARPWLRTGVRVENTDPSDPAPYWLVASRRPRALADALAAGQTGDTPSREDARGEEAQ